MFALYIRVSTDLQASDKRYGLQRQRREIHEYLARIGATAGPEFVDVISGTKEQRAGLERLLDAARSGAVRCVAVSEYDRLGRNLFTSFALMAELVAAGLEIHSAIDGVFDPNSSASRRAFASRSSDADAELERITRRMYAGKLEKARSGQPVAPIRAYGHPASAATTPAQTETVKWIFHAITNMGQYVVARALNDRGIDAPKGGMWRANTIRAIIRNPVYRGQYQFGRRGDRISVPVDRVVDDATWWAANRAIDQRQRSGGRLPGARLNDFWLQRRIFCAVCGGAMSGFASANNKHHYYHCRKSLVREFKQMCSHSTYYRASDIHSAVQAQLRALLDAPENLPAMRPPAMLPSSDASKLKARLTRLTEAYLAGAIPLAEYQPERGRLEAAIRDASQQQPIPQRDGAELLAVLRSALDGGLSWPDIASAVNLRVAVGTGGALSLELG